MTETLLLVVYMAIVTWITLLVPSLIRTKGWTMDGTILMMGNRDNLPPESALAGRAARTALNTVDNFVLFAAIALIAHAAGAESPKLVMGAQLFFWARLVYIPVYYAGIKYLRTLVWVASIVGLAMMVLSLV